ncbi:hypothetical protein J2847_004098 [Azospirillum agricola]|nr:hypothetical protein [Azospirillum agricola]
MRKWIVVAGLVLVSTASLADTYTRGYVRRDGTYVQPHFSTPRNSNPFDNYSTRGNVNPYTGQAGTVNPYAAPANPYSGYGSQQRTPCYGLNCR